MNSRLIECLCSKLIGCRWCAAVLADSQELVEHLAEHHAANCSRQEVVEERETDDEIAKPNRLFFCGHEACGFVVADTETWNATATVIHHIEEKHPNLHGPVRITFRVTTDSDFIKRWLEGRTVHRFDCLECNKTFGTLHKVVDHCVREHKNRITRALVANEVRAAVDAEPLRFRMAVADCRIRIAAEDYRGLIRASTPDDGYEIRKQPGLPHVRGTPIKQILYVVRQCRPSDEELDAILAGEGIAFDDEGNLIDGWQGDERTEHIDLTFCNIHYCPIKNRLMLS